MNENDLPIVTVRENARIGGSESDNILSLRFMDASDRAAGSDFYELLWMHRVDDDWKPNARITAERFQAGSPFRRWISDLHSFNAEQMSAIVQVGEADALQGKSYKVIYSWRRLSLRGDDQLELLQTCASPFERFIGD